MIIEIETYGRKYILCFLLLFFCACTKNVGFLSDTPPLPPLIQLTFDQVATQKKVDILFIVDNSTSMKPDLKAISNKFQDFISYISTSDYRIGFINTDVMTSWQSDSPGFYGNLKPVGENGEIYIDSSMNNQEELFISAIQDQPMGHPTEKPLQAILMAVEKRFTTNKDFFRDEAQFISVIISDEDESADEIGLSNPHEVYEELVQEFGSSHINSVTIGIPPGDDECAEQQEKIYSTILWSYTQLLKGVTVSICNPSIGQELRKISSFIQSTLSYRDIPLIPRPQKGEEIDVKITSLSTGEILHLDWIIVDEQILSFFNRPPLGSRIKISYFSSEEFQQ